MATELLQLVQMLDGKTVAEDKNKCSMVQAR